MHYTVEPKSRHSSPYLLKNFLAAGNQPGFFQMGKFFDSSLQTGCFASVRYLHGEYQLQGRLASETFCPFLSITMLLKSSFHVGSYPRVVETGSRLDNV